MIRRILLSGASALALFALADQAAAGTVYVDTTPGTATYIVPTTGSYYVDVWGAQGGTGYYAKKSLVYAGGKGYGQQVEVGLTAGEKLYLYVGQKGSNGSTIYGGGGGGGSSAVLLTAGDPINDAGGGVISGGGGGGAAYGAGGNGQPGAFAAPGGSGYGSGAGGGGFFGSPGKYSENGAPGGGLDLDKEAGPYEGAGFDAGGAGGAGLVKDVAGGGAGGSGFSGGGGGYLGGGGGGGVSGGGGGGSGYGGGGGGSYYFVGSDVKALAYRSGDGEVEISSVPEPSAWALMFSGFGFIGYVLRRRVTRAM